MILIEPYAQECKKTGRKTMIAGSAWCERTGRAVIIDDTPLRELGAYFCQDRQSWVLPSSRDDAQRSAAGGTQADRSPIKEDDMEAHKIADLEAQDAILGFDGPYRFLSNFGAGKTHAYGITFPTVEHGFAAIKLDPEGGVFTRAEVIAEMSRIASLSSPGEAKRAGRRRTWDGTQPKEGRRAAQRPFLRTDWEAKKFDLVLELVRRKFADPVLREKLLATGDRPLYELNTWGDRIWGVVAKGDELIGTNWLGKILMQVRDEICASGASSQNFLQHAKRQRCRSAPSHLPHRRNPQ